MRGASVLVRSGALAYQAPINTSVSTESVEKDNSTIGTVKLFRDIVSLINKNACHAMA